MVRNKILIVDDITENIQVVANVLRDEGYNLSYAKDGKTALERVEKTDFDLILLDVMMPDMDGFEVCDKLKANPKTNEIPIIFLTGKADTQSIVEGFKRGGVDYITKPFNAEELKVRVQIHISLRNAYEKLEIESKRNEELLKNILPQYAINSLKDNGVVDAKNYENVTIMFTDFSGFTKKTADIDPKLLIDELNIIFTAFDDIMEKYNCERIKTIGDAYMAIGGLAKDCNGAQNIVLAAKEIINYLKCFKGKITDKWNIRIGINSGKVTGGIVGVKKYAFDYFGETVNLASRMEKLSNDNRINITENTRKIVENLFELEDRGLIDVKGFGPTQMYFVK